MNPPLIHEVLAQLQDGALTLEAAEARLTEYVRGLPFEDLGFARVDHHRAIRLGMPEVIFGLGKTPEQIAAIAARIASRGQTLLVTRASRAAYDAVVAEVPDATYHGEAHVIARRQDDLPRGTGTILIASAGTSDQPVAEEAAICAEVMNNEIDRLYDVGVSGLHRLLSSRDRLDAARAVIVVAGMEGALPSVIGGLVRVPVIAVPTSVGYGASFGGVAALLGMLNSCAPGVAVVNIDNGFGAACIASQINHL
ncbi:MAG: nickel pincer cofactor biosynthesis protein LarB [Acidobacteria bacterium]|nr:nickel pincer cofactor biosynthesis protein LarB [Acidobacteriota bacterium]